VFSKVDTLAVFIAWFLPALYSACSSSRSIRLASGADGQVYDAEAASVACAIVCPSRVMLRAVGDVAAGSLEVQFERREAVTARSMFELDQCQPSEGAAEGRKRRSILLMAWYATQQVIEEGHGALASVNEPGPRVVAALERLLQLPAIAGECGRARRSG
jgi:hypothetical protein